ncbi:low temperature requirement protein A [Dactylosporangium sp. AC04546]|uniref:low temperature requirement protein A n=1 Tax=Dactylosporangium sp. AC04546 TaxID=2862460 RepID=UPI001EDF789C|nr:low temperature requirement protein A [Dactylosporangium sp. AC04546]WVK85491.1 low temperature requirement protein A [Dactylosporangium sp. AC04546]
MSTTPRWRRPMLARDKDEQHRAATPLELLFDLCFVVAIAVAGRLLHHSISEHHVAHGIGAYLMVFFAIWWAWMNFTWFASAYDTDDVPYRLTALVQIAGVLVLAAGVEDAFEGDYVIVTLGYVIMRAGLVTQWLRAAHADPERRRTALRMAIGVSACMVGWGLILLTHDTLHVVLFLVMIGFELAVPMWAERRVTTPWHAHHIAERYGLLFIIVLGEIVLSTTLAVQAGFVQDRLWWVAASGLVIVFAFWWLYFDEPAHRRLVDNRHAFVWGYGHYVVFASAAAIGAGIAVVVDNTTSRLTSSLAVAVPVAILLVALWVLHLRRSWLLPGGAVLVLVSALFGPALVLVAIIMAALVAAWVATTPGR